MQIEICEEHCKADSGPACGTAAKKYSRGIGVKKNVKKSLELGLRGCELGDADACEIADLTYSGIYDAPGANFENQAARGALARRHLELLQRDCDATDGDACETLSVFYSKDWYVPIRIEGNPAKAAALGERAIRLHKQACDGGDGYACMQLARNYASRSDETPEADARNDDLLRRACELGYAASCSLAGAGDLGANGAALLRRGCDLGDSESCSMLASTLRIQGADAEAMTLELRACDLRDSLACKKLGDRLRGTDPEAAQRAFDTACALGDDESCGLKQP